MIMILRTRLLTGIGAGLALFAYSHTLYAQTPLPSDSTDVIPPTTTALVLCPKVILNGITLGTIAQEIPLSASTTCRTVTSSAVTVGIGALAAVIFVPYTTSSTAACNADESIQQHTLNLNLPGGSTLGYTISLNCCKRPILAHVSYDYTEAGKCPGP